MEESTAILVELGLLKKQYIPTVKYRHLKNSCNWVHGASKRQTRWSLAFVPEMKLEMVDGTCVLVTLCKPVQGLRWARPLAVFHTIPLKGFPEFSTAPPSPTYQLLSLRALNPPIIPLKCQRYFQTQRRITFPHVDAAKPSLETEVAVVSGDFSH